MAQKTNYPFTRVPNFLFDEVLPSIDSLAELKVVLAVIRRTLGWHDSTKTITVSELIKLTGLSRQGVLDGLKKAIENSEIARSPIRKKNGRASYAYRYIGGYVKQPNNAQED